MTYHEHITQTLNNISESSYFKNDESFKKLFKQKELKKGELFISEGDIPKEIGFMCRGLTKFYYLDNKGNEWIKHLAIENEFITAYGNFIHQTPALYYIQALETTQLLTLSYQTYTQLLATSKEWSDVARKFTEGAYYNKEIREATFLKMDAKERYLNFLKEYSHLVDRISVKDMASFLGMNYVSLSRIRGNI